MKLWLLTQTDNRGYDTYDACIVAEDTEEKAKQIHPSFSGDWGSGTWANSPESVKVSIIGTAKKGTTAGVILASFNAG